MCSIERKKRWSRRPENHESVWPCLFLWALCNALGTRRSCPLRESWEIFRFLYSICPQAFKRCWKLPGGGHMGQYSNNVKQQSVLTICYKFHSSDFYLFGLHFMNWYLAPTQWPALLLLLICCQWWNWKCLWNKINCLNWANVTSHSVFPLIPSVSRPSGLSFMHSHASLLSSLVTPFLRFHNCCALSSLYTSRSSSWCSPYLNKQ